MITLEQARAAVAAEFAHLDPEVLDVALENDTEYLVRWQRRGELRLGTPVALVNKTSGAVELVPYLLHRERIEAMREL